jgi:hypothetical protein
MAPHNKREFWFITLSALAAAPLIASMGLVFMSGIVAW